MNPIREDCKYLLNTTYRRNFYQKEITKGKRGAELIPITEDPVLIDGHFARNLTVENKPPPYIVKDHPFVKNNNENYECYVKKILSKDETASYQKCYKCPKVNIEIVKDQLNKLNKTCYQNCYSPNEYCSIKENIRLKNCNIEKPPGWKSHQTTYLSSYNRIEEIGDSKKYIDGSENCKPPQSQLQEQLKKIYKTGKTIYYTDICEPALIKMDQLRTKKLLTESPLDQYTLRRV